VTGKNKKLMSLVDHKKTTKSNPSPVSSEDWTKYDESESSNSKSAGKNNASPQSWIDPNFQNSSSPNYQQNSTTPLGTHNNYNTSNSMQSTKDSASATDNYGTTMKGQLRGEERFSSEKGLGKSSFERCNPPSCSPPKRQPPVHEPMHEQGGSTRVPPPVHEPPRSSAVLDHWSELESAILNETATFTHDNNPNKTHDQSFVKLESSSKPEVFSKNSTKGCPVELLIPTSGKNSNSNHPSHGAGKSKGTIPFTGRPPPPNFEVPIVLSAKPATVSPGKYNSFLPSPRFPQTPETPPPPPPPPLSPENFIHSSPARSEISDDMLLPQLPADIYGESRTNFGHLNSLYNVSGTNTYDVNSRNIYGMYHDNSSNLSHLSTLQRELLKMGSNYTNEMDHLVDGTNLKNLSASGTSKSYAQLDYSSSPSTNVDDTSNTLPLYDYHTGVKSTGNIISTKGKQHAAKKYEKVDKKVTNLMGKLISACSSPAHKSSAEGRSPKGLSDQTPPGLSPVSQPADSNLNLSAADHSLAAQWNLYFGENQYNPADPWHSYYAHYYGQQSQDWKNGYGFPQNLPSQEDQQNLPTSQSILNMMFTSEGNTPNVSGKGKNASNSENASSGGKVRTPPRHSPPPNPEERSKGGPPSYLPPPITEQNTQHLNNIMSPANCSDKSSSFNASSNSSNSRSNSASPKNFPEEENQSEKNEMRQQSNSPGEQSSVDSSVNRDQCFVLPHVDDIGKLDGKVDETLIYQCQEEYDGQEISETGVPETGYLAVQNGEAIKFIYKQVYPGHSKNRESHYMWAESVDKGIKGWFPVRVVMDRGN